MPYTEIAITTIADKLIWSRANLYKYVTTKEEIFLELSAMLALSADEAYKLQLNILMFAATTAVSCYKNPLIQQALQKIGITLPNMDFYEDMRDFVLMRIRWSVRER